MCENMFLLFPSIKQANPRNLMPVFFRWSEMVQVSAGKPIIGTGRRKTVTNLRQKVCGNCGELLEDRTMVRGSGGKGVLGMCRWKLV